eukprot:3057161-Prymnesium_polylepis.1
MHHMMQLELIKAVDELDERPLAIGMEMFCAPPSRPAAPPPVQTARLSSSLGCTFYRRHITQSLDCDGPALFDTAGRQHQRALDEYVFGRGSFEELLRETRWE